MPSREPPEIQAITNWLAAREPGVETARAHAFLAEILAWNDRLRLVSKREPAAVLTRLVQRSVALWRAVGEGAGAPASAVDLGAGGGFPGVVWKLIAPAVHLLLIERSERKAVFLERVTARLGLEGVEVFAGDAREAARLPRHQAAYDGAVAMAVGRPADVGPVVAPLVRAGGWYATVGPVAPIPPARLEGAWRLRRTWPLDEAVIVLYARDDL